LTDDDTKKLNSSLPAMHILLAARSKENGQAALEGLVKRGAKNVSFIQIDLDDVKTFATAAAEIKKTYGGLDVAIHNAGEPFAAPAPSLLLVAHPFVSCFGCAQAWRSRYPT
jgi:NAD(P)-dependent dehydrogenase (short-subunit alcohol dehydrogenase family)